MFPDVRGLGRRLRSGEQMYVFAELSFPPRYTFWHVEGLELSYSSHLSNLHYDMQMTS